MAKAPLPGRVKTRLSPPCSPVEAARIAEAALTDTLIAVAACRADHKVIALEGPAGDWLPPGMHVIPQRGSGFAERLSHAWEDAGPYSNGWGIQIGMDTPQVTAGDLDRALSQLAPGRAVLGPALDGGWWVIGLPGTDPYRVFTDIPMSTSTTAAQQVRRLRELGLEVGDSGPQRDIDTFADLVAVTAMIPDSRTAAAAAGIAATAPDTAPTRGPELVP